MPKKSKRKAPEPEEEEGSDDLWGASDGEEVRADKRSKLLKDLSDEEEDVARDSEEEWGEDLIGDDEDRARLNKMTQKEREMVLYKRAQRRTEKQQAIAARANLASESKAATDDDEEEEEEGEEDEDDEDDDDAPVVKKRSKKADKEKKKKKKKKKNKEDKKKKKEKKKKEKKKKKKKKKKQEEESEEEDEEAEEEEEEDDAWDEEEEEPQQREPRRSMRDRTKALDTETDEALNIVKSVDYDSDDEDSADDRGRRETVTTERSDTEDDDRYEDEAQPKKRLKHLKIAPKVNTPLTYQALKAIQIRKNYMAKLFIEQPFFADYVTGTFVRIAIGQNQTTNEIMYRCCEVMGVVDWRTRYKFAGQQTKKAIEVSEGRSSRIWMMNQVSNQTITQDEMDRYIRNCNEAGRKVLSSQEAWTRKKAKEKLRNEFVVTPAQIHQMVADRRDKSFKGQHLGREKLRLQQLLYNTDDPAEISKIQRKQDELAEYELNLRRKESQHSSAGTTEINKKNVENNNKILKLLSKQLVEEKKDGTLKPSPFYRRVADPNQNAAIWDVMKVEDLSEAQKMEYHAAMAKKEAAKKAAEEEERKKNFKRTLNVLEKPMWTVGKGGRVITVEEEEEDFSDLDNLDNDTAIPVTSSIFTQTPTPAGLAYSLLQGAHGFSVEIDLTLKPKVKRSRLSGGPPPPPAGITPERTFSLEAYFARFHVEDEDN